MYYWYYKNAPVPGAPLPLPVCSIFVLLLFAWPCLTATDNDLALAEIHSACQKVIKIQIFWDTPPPSLLQTPLTNVWRWIWFLVLIQSNVPGTGDVYSGMIRSLDPIICKWKIAQLKASRFQFNVLRPFAKQHSGGCAIEGADSKRPLVLGRGLTEANIVNGPVPTPCTLVLHTHGPCYMPPICIDHTCALYTSLGSLHGCLVESITCS